MTNKKAKISEHFVALRGRAYKTDTSNLQEIKILNVKDINTNFVDIAQCESQNIDTNLDENLFLQKGDVVIPCRGNGTIKVGIITSIDEPCVPSQNVILIRETTAEVSSEYLKIFFESPIGKDLLTKLQGGGAIKLISHKDLLQLEIPIPDKDTQAFIIKEFNKGKSEYEQQIKQAVTTWESKQSSLYAKFN